MSEFWAGLEAISTAVAALTVVGGLLYAKSQVSEAKSARNASLLLDFQATYHERARREFRLRLLSGEFGPPSRFNANALEEDDRFSFWMLVDDLELLGVLVDKKLLDFDVVVAAFRSTPPTVWHYIRPTIVRGRAERPPGHGFYLERLAERYERYYQETFGVPHPGRGRMEALEAAAKAEKPPPESTSGQTEIAT